MIIVTNQTITFTSGTAELIMEEIADTYNKTIVNAFAQLKSASSAVITSTTISSNKVAIKCSNLSGTGYSGTIAVTILLILA